MSRQDFWLLSAGKDGELWPAFWTERKVAIGWSALGDLRELPSRDALAQKHARVWPKENPRARGVAVGQVWRFYKEMKEGDVVFVRSYVALIGVALIEGAYEFLSEDHPLRQKFYSPYFKDHFPHVRAVRWISLGGGMKQQLTLTRLTIMGSS